MARRRLRYAIVTSTLLHLMLLWPGVPPRLTQDTPAPLRATLKQPALPKPPPSKVSRAVSPAPTLALPVPEPKLNTLEPLKAPVVPQAPVFPLEPATKLSPAPEAPGAATAATPGPTSAAAVAGDALVTDVGASGEALQGLRGYRLAVAAQARRFKRYPPQAMASGWVGSADVRVEVGSDGRARAATLVRSSGHELLDQAALAMIDAGALRARLPESLRGKSFAVALPVVFNLDEE